jgi:hypothetical protein
MNKSDILNALDKGLEVINMDNTMYITRSKGLDYLVFRKKGQGFLITNYESWAIKSNKWKLSSYSEYLAK